MSLSLSQSRKHILNPLCFINFTAPVHEDHRPILERFGFLSILNIVPLIRSFLLAADSRGGESEDSEVLIVSVTESSESDGESEVLVTIDSRADSHPSEIDAAMEMVCTRFAQPEPRKTEPDPPLADLEPADRGTQIRRKRVP